MNLTGLIIIVLGHYHDPYWSTDYSSAGITMTLTGLLIIVLGHYHDPYWSDYSSGALP